MKTAGTYPPQAGCSLAAETSPRPPRGTPIQNMAAAMASGGTGHGPAGASPRGAPILTRRLPVGPSSFNSERRTCTAVIATTTAVRRAGPAPDGSPGDWLEVLTISREAIDLSRIIGGPVLLGHDLSRAGSHVGTITAVKIEDGRLVAELKFSGRSDVEPVLADIRDGILQQVSAGYQVSRWRKQAGNPATFIAERWQPLEASVLPLAADGECLIRAATLEAGNMPDALVDAVEAGEKASEWTADEIMDLMVSAENLNVRSGVSVVGELRQRGLSPDQARRELINRKADEGDRIQTRPHIRIGYSSDDPVERARAMGEGLYCRINPQHKPSEAARPYAGLSIPEIARACLDHAGQSTRGLNDRNLVTRALTTTSDYPAVFANTVGRELRRLYDQAPRGVMQTAARTTNPDFRAKAMVAFGDDIGLEKVNEAGEYKYGVLKEAGENVKIETFGKIYAFSRQLQVNDDLSALQRIPQLFAASARAKEDQVVVDLLASNPTMSDGVALFHVNHGNLAGAGAAPSETTLGAATLGMRLQKGLSGKPINLEPSILLVPAALEVTALKLVTAIEAGTVDAVNPFAGRLRVVVDSRLDAKSATAWYVVADPAVHDGLTVAYLEGQEGVTIETRQGWEIDGTEIKCRLDFGAAFTDFRAWFRNPG